MREEENHAFFVMLEDEVAEVPWNKFQYWPNSSNFLNTRNIKSLTTL